MMTCFLTLLGAYSLIEAIFSLRSHEPIQGIWQSCATTPMITLFRVCLLDVCKSTRSLITARTASAPTADTLNLLILLQLLPRDTADACAVEVGLLGLNATQAAKLSRNPRQQLHPPQSDPHASRTHLLISLLLPLRDQHRIGVVVLEQPVVQLLTDGFLLVVQIVDVS